MDFVLKAMGAAGGLTLLCPLTQGLLLLSLHEMSMARVDWLCQTPLGLPEKLPSLGGLWSPSDWVLPSSRVLATVAGIAMSRPGLTLLSRRRGSPPRFSAITADFSQRPRLRLWGGWPAREGALPSSCQGVTGASPSLFHLLLFSLGQAWG